MEARAVTDLPTKQPVDALVVPLFEREAELPAAVAELDRTLDGAASAALGRGGFRGEMLEQLPLSTLGRLASPTVLLVGVGRRQVFDLVRLRNALHAAARWLRTHGSRRIAVLIGDAIGSGSQADVARAVTEGIGLGDFEARALRSINDGEDVRLSELRILGLGDSEEVRSAVGEGLTLAEATNRAREWVNLPANALTPTAFVDRVQAAIRGSGLDLQVLEPDEIDRLKMGALKAVARGSDEPPRVMVLRYRKGRGGGRPALGLVGKGITFDSGGISLKPGAGMEMMKSDMGGGAAVINAIWAISQLQPAINVIAVVPTTENMPSGKATRPGDVVTASSGKTIEIINTDAEGRLILADGINYAIEQGATHIVDVATLTGSIARTLGPVSTGAFTNDAGFMSLVQQAAELAGERVWQLPTWADYDGLIKSEIADIKNSTVPWAGATTAALFLREFVRDRPWVHLDIAGSAWQDANELKTIPKGPTGAAVRTLAHLARLVAAA